jgi:hypothetical protein
MILIPSAGTTTLAAAAPRASGGPTVNGRGWSYGRKSDRSSHQGRILDVQIVFYVDWLSGLTASRGRNRRRPAPRRSLFPNVRGRTRTAAASGLLTRIACFVQLNKFVLAHRRRGNGLLTLDHGIRHARCVQLYGTHCVVITGDNVVDAVR